MDLETLREKLDDEQFTALESFVNDLTGQRDSARKESIQHRQSLKAKAADLEKENESLKKAQSDLLERLGVESLEQIEELDPKGQAEAARQYEAKLKRLERDMQERQAAYDTLHNKHRSTLQTAAMQAAMQGHEWIDADLVSSYVQTRLVWDDDAVKFQADDGLTMDLKEGIQVLAKDKPHLVKAAGAGGSGYRGAPKSGVDAGPKVMTRNEFEALNPAARMTHIKSGGKVTD